MTNFIDTQNKILSQSEKLQNAQAVADILVTWGWSQNAICALCGNMSVESYLNPNMWQAQTVDLSQGYGLVQWTPATKLISWAQAAGQDYTKGETQMERIKYEYENGVQWIARSSFPLSFAEFSVSQQSIAYLTEAFGRNYERPYNLSESLQRRIDFANLCSTSLNFDGSGGTVRISPYKPVYESTPVTSGFEERWGTFHYALDFGGAANDPIFATMAGFVTHVSFDNSRGYYIIIKHTADGLYSTYQHLADAGDVTVGQGVLRGQTIGRMGTTGQSTGVHLHFAISDTPYGVYGDDGNVGQFFDPAEYLLRTFLIGGEEVPSFPFPVADDTQNTPQKETWKNMSLYKVKAGDTLSAIAKKHGVAMSRIRIMKPAEIANPNKLQIDDLLAIPLNEAQIAAALPVSYKVKAGDTLSAIAAAHGKSVAYVQQMNAINNPDRIFEGQVLYI